MEFPSVLKPVRFVLVLFLAILGLGGLLVASHAQSSSLPVDLTDQTSIEPLLHPFPGVYEARYISGFGLDETFTVFFEDRSESPSPIAFASTTSGPLGFGPVATQTNIYDTHFVVKDWPIELTGTLYAYRGWGAVGNNPQHRFYVSQNMITWTNVSTFTIRNATGFTNAKGFVYYGFHDVILLNGTYYAFGESNQSQTMILSSTTGTDDWIAFASVGGPEAADGPLQLPSGVTSGWTPTGNFLDVENDEGMFKAYADPRDSAFYIALNPAVQSSLAAAEREAAFIDPANWTWHDGTAGPAASPVLSETGHHDLRECWVVPRSSPDAGWVLMYDAAYDQLPIGKVLGYATLDIDLPSPLEPGYLLYLPVIFRE